MNLQQLFRVNPLRGYRKLLSVGYVARGLMGTLRVPVDVQTGRLLADLFIGFPPAPPPPPIELESERLAREMREFEEQVEKAKAARSRELRRKHRLRQQGKGGAPRARRSARAARRGARAPRASGLCRGRARRWSRAAPAPEPLGPRRGPMHVLGRRA